MTLTRMITLTATAGVLIGGCSDTQQEDDEVEYAAFVRGTLAITDLAEARAHHDQVAGGGEAAAREAGDFGHAVFLGTTLLDSVENEFLAIDRWSDAAAMRDFYEQVGTFNGLFTGPPEIRFYSFEPEWVSWGEHQQPGDHFVHLAIGQLSAADTAEAQAAHDQVAGGGKDPSIAAGNVAHLVYLGLDNPRDFIGVDIWASDENLAGFYQNPDFRAAFEPLFVEVSEPVFASTDWHKW